MAVTFRDLFPLVLVETAVGETREMLLVMSGMLWT